MNHALAQSISYSDSLKGDEIKGPRALEGTLVSSKQQGLAFTKEKL